VTACRRSSVDLPEKKISVELLIDRTAALYMLQILGSEIRPMSKIGGMGFSNWKKEYNLRGTVMLI